MVYCARSKSRAQKVRGRTSGPLIQASPIVAHHAPKPQEAITETRTGLSFNLAARGPEWLISRSSSEPRLPTSGTEYAAATRQGKVLGLQTGSQLVISKPSEEGGGSNVGKEERSSRPRTSRVDCLLRVYGSIPCCTEEMDGRQVPLAGQLSCWVLLHRFGVFFFVIPGKHTVGSWCL